MMKSTPIQGLEPAFVWRLFWELSQHPRPSKRENKAVAFLEKYFQEKGVPYEKDHANNLIAFLPASPGYETAPIVVCQSHIDMVCVKTENATHDFEHDPIDLIREGDWIRANNTTLGADNGVGLAVMLAITEDDSIVHPPLRLLVTTNEEAGMTGAKAVSKDWLSGAQWLINLDGENAFEIELSCAGGIDTLAFKQLSWSNYDDTNTETLKLSIKNLTGGHSGMRISHDGANAIKILAEVLNKLYVNYNISVSDIAGGEARNAIPDSSWATISVKSYDLSKVTELSSTLEHNFKEQYAMTDPQLQISLESIAPPKRVLARQFLEGLVKTLLKTPHGVHKWVNAPELPETSSNLARVGITQEGKLFIETNQRSSVQGEKEHLAEKVAAVFMKEKFETQHQNSYPAWQFDQNNKLFPIAGQAYKNIFGKDLQLHFFHAGLEVAILLEKSPPYCHAICLGATIREAHTPRERVHIPSVDQLYCAIKEILRLLVKQN